MQMIDSMVDEIYNDIIKFRREFHKYPELGWLEVRTASRIARILSELGFSVSVGKNFLKPENRMGLPSQKQMDEAYDRAIISGGDLNFAEQVKDGYTAIVACMDFGPGPTIGLRFDIDALPIFEAAVDDHIPFKEGFSSEIPGVMHGCGHDGHIAIGLGIAMILAKNKTLFNGKIKLIFQPAEEGVRGGKAIAQSGILDDVDYLLAGHIGIFSKSSGEIYCGMKGFYATSKLDISFKGKSSHAGINPEEGTNALLAAATATLQMHSISRNGKGKTFINVGMLNGGSGRNIIPDFATMMIETRGETEELNCYMKEHAIRISKGAAQIYNVSCEFEEMGEASDGSSNEKLVEIIAKSASEISGFHKIYDEVSNFSGSEDFTHMMKRVQQKGGESAYLVFGSDIAAPHHNERFDFEEKILPAAVKVLLHTSLRLMRNDL